MYSYDNERRRRGYAVLLLFLIAMLGAAGGDSNDENPTEPILSPTATATLTPTLDLQATVAAQGKIIAGQQATLESMTRNGIVVPNTITPEPNQFSPSSN